MFNPEQFFSKFQEMLFNYNQGMLAKFNAI